MSDRSSLTRLLPTAAHSTAAVAPAAASDHHVLLHRRSMRLMLRLVRMQVGAVGEGCVASLLDW